ncbi:MAG: regulator SirB [Leptothrix sp. (in: Bacteria)]|nr:regulator SirB [Leptothrix sp. (in: b-proteobacteria)]
MQALAEHYITFRQLHLGFVTASGCLFALRAFASLAGAGWPLARPARVASWVIDTGLLTAGALLWAALQVHPLQQTWLGMKLVLLLVYIGLGTMALRRARTPAARLGWTLAALACFGWIVGTAIAHDLRGPLRWLAG